MVSGYSDLSVAALGSHSALEIMDGAKDENFRTLVLCQKGRDAPYRRFSRISDEIIMLAKFSDMLRQRIQSRLREENAIIVPHRALTAYLGYGAVENRLRVPLFGNRALFQAEERSHKKNQYYLLQKASLRMPRIFADPRDIDRPVIVKGQEKSRKLERAFFIATSYADYKDKTERKIRQGLISRDALKIASIEEFVIGTYFNFNYFHTPISDDVDFLGIERRLQTNVHDFVSLPAKQQLETNIELQNIEVGHTPASIRESLLEKVIEAGDRFVSAVRREYHPGIIGPFSLQSVITRDLEIVVYDVSLRVPGNPILATTSPYTKYKYGTTFGVGRRIAMEIRKAQQEGKLAHIVS